MALDRDQVQLVLDWIKKHFPDGCPACKSQGGYSFRDYVGLQAMFSGNPIPVEVEEPMIALPITCLKCSYMFLVNLRVFAQYVAEINKTQLRLFPEPGNQP